MGFVKSRQGVVTRYLFVAGVNGMCVRQLAELFAPYGNPEVLVPRPRPPPACDGADTAAAAAAASASAQPPLSQSPSPTEQPQYRLGDADADRGTEAVPADDPGAVIRSHHAYLAFGSEGEAAAAAAAVPRGRDWDAAGGRRLATNFAEVWRDKRPVPRPVALTAEEAGVPGLSLRLGFVSEQQEAALLAAVEAAGSSSGGGGGSGWHVMAKRRVQHHGYTFDYILRTVDTARPLGPLPPWAADLAARMEQLPEVAQRLDQLTVNEYEPGVGIAPHVDRHSAFTGPILILSLGSPTVMEMRRGEAMRPLLLPRCSLLVLAGEARYAWQHYIPNRTADPVGGQLLQRTRRVSLTFRQVRGFACGCAYPEACDSQEGPVPPTRLATLRGLDSCSPSPPPADAQQHGLPGQQHANGAASPPLVNGAAHPTTNRAAAAAAADGAAPRAAPPIACTRCATSDAHGNDSDGGDAAKPSAADGCSGGGATGGSGSSGAGSGQGAGGGQRRGGGGGGGGEDAGDGGEAALAALEAQHVHRVYDVIAPHFSATRFAVWPRVRAFIDSLPPGGVVADVGCGNGKYFGVRRDLAVLGSDICAGLVEVAAQRLRPAGRGPAAAPHAADALVADALRLPYRPGSCDGALCIAVLHHLTSPARRVRMLRQLLRVLRPGGRGLVTVWATEQEDPAKTVAKWTRIPPPTAGAAPAAAAVAGQAAPPSSSGCGGGGGPVDDSAPSSGSGGVRSSSGAAEGQDFFVPWHLPFHRAETAQAVRAAREPVTTQHAGGGDTAPGTSGRPHTAPRVDSAKGAVVFQRFYHLFTRDELQGLVLCALEAGPGHDDSGDGGGGGKEGPGSGSAEAAVGRSGAGASGGDGKGRASSAWGVVEEVYYDRSNWCAVFRRTR